MVCVWGGGKQYVTNVCMYVAIFRLYSGIITQTARRRAHRKCRRESVSNCIRPIVLSDKNHHTTSDVLWTLLCGP